MHKGPRSLPLPEWPQADRWAWQDACRPGLRLKAGGPASHLGAISRDDYERRYGAFLGFLQRANVLKGDVAAAGQVTPVNIEAYLADLTSRVRTVTAYNCISKVRRVASLIAPHTDLSWLSDIENDLAFVMEPQSKFGRFVFTDRLVEAGLALVAESSGSGKDPLSRARGVRNGLMVALLAPCPIRLKNFAGLELGTTFKKDQSAWWIILTKKATKNRRADERRVPEILYPAIDLYLTQSRLLLLGNMPDTGALWVSSRTGRALTKKNLGTLISKLTLEMVDMDVSPHLFRTAGASTSAYYAPDHPHLGSALLGHTDARINDDHYRRVSSINACKAYGAIIQSLCGLPLGQSKL